MLLSQLYQEICKLFLVYRFVIVSVILDAVDFRYRDDRRDGLAMVRLDVGSRVLPPGRPIGLLDGRLSCAELIQIQNTVA